MNRWTIRTMAAATSPIMGLAVTLFSPFTTGSAVAGAPTSGMPTAAEVRTVDASVAVGIMSQDVAAQPCRSVDALEATTALSRRVGSLDVVRVSQAVAWDQAEAQTHVVMVWCGA